MGAIFLMMLMADRSPTNEPLALDSIFGLPFWIGFFASSIGTIWSHEQRRRAKKSNGGDDV
jgi:hypothetical protein